MPADLKNAFAESCCDGGATNTEQSAQPCGCDLAARWQCETHRTGRAVDHGKDRVIYRAQDEQVAQQTKEWADAAIRRLATKRDRTRVSTFPSAPAERKKYPMFTGLIAYFPDALAAISHVSWRGNEQHNPGEPLHWAREKSTDQEDTIIRHLAEAGKRDTDGERHTAKAAWRILALLQLEIEAEQERNIS